MRSHDFSISRFARRTAGAFGLVAGIGALGAGCLTRPVQPGSPSLKTNFTTPVKQKAVDKLDLLFMIDNSASMGDKQAILGDAVPDLMARLVTPNCVDAKGNPILDGAGNPVTTSDGTCANGKAEFQPVHDMHIGVVSSSLGGRGSDACAADAPNPVDGTKNGHNDDSAHLLDRGGADEHTVNNAIQNANAGSFFLAWFPTTDANTGTSHPTPAKPETVTGTLNTDFADLVTGVHEYGCGYEAQLESWYRFLVQPDPYKSIAGGYLDKQSGTAKLVDVDVNILQQRADFLRDDSLVAIIILTDENDSTVDPLALGGQGWAYENGSFPGSNTGGGAAKGTSACAANPNDPNCTSCGFCRGGTPSSICNDPVCQAASYYTPQEESQNERFFQMKKRFGVDPQFPISRYINGLQSAKVPDRNGEHPVTNGTPSADYVGKNNCVNPLYAQNSHDPADTDPTHHLPTTWNAQDPATSDALCNLTPGGRDPTLVYFAAITGIPWQLLTDNKADPAHGNFKSSFTNDDWTALIGKDPLNYDTTGADPHMIESLVPRTGIAANDPIVGSDYTTNGSDLEYACTFPLSAPKDCTQTQYKFACDCTNGKQSPLCDTTNPNLQIRGKAYPSLRELSVVRGMGDQGIVASLCPKVVDNKADPDYGYRPAVRVIIDRLKNALANQCLPQPLTADKTTGQVPCLILLTLTNTPNGGDESACAPKYDVPAADILAKFRQGQEADWNAAGGKNSGKPDPAQFPVCQLKEIVEKAGETCANDPTAGWCYVVNSNGNTPAGTCSQAILFTQSGNPAGASIFLECVESNTVDVGTSADGG